MKFEQLLEIIRGEPVFETGLLLAGDTDPIDVRKQLSRWVNSGQIYQLRRGLYSLAPPYQKTIQHPFLIANRMMHGSYVSCQSALAFYGLIPERVPLTISVSTGRPAHWHTSLGDFQFRHIAPKLFTGYQLVDLTQDQQAFVASPEKALIDMVHLTTGGDNPAYLRALRLQNLERLDLDQLFELTQQFRKPKLYRATTTIAEVATEDIETYEII